MDHFERQLAQMMRDTEAPAPFEPKHRERLWAGVRVRGRRRVAQRAVGSALAVVGLSVGLFLLPGHATRVDPSHPRPQPATSPSPSAPPATPDVSPSAPSSSGTSTAPASPDGTAPITPPATTGSTATATMTPPGNTEGASPPSTSAPPSGTATARN
ncbi:cellulase [Streptomyces sp. NPDC057445]|uniref:cellulase n=1 Tax=Streptomyces sp. NPDC057445 TaxID=3346136 RepID=UPI003689A37D